MQCRVSINEPSLDDRSPTTQRPVRLRSPWVFDIHRRITLQYSAAAIDMLACRTKRSNACRLKHASYLYRRTPTGVRSIECVSVRLALVAIDETTGHCQLRNRQPSRSQLLLCKCDVCRLHSACATVPLGLKAQEQNTVYFTCSEKLTDSQLSLPHGMNKM